MTKRISMIILGLFMVLFLLSRRETVECVRVSGMKPPRCFARAAAMLLKKLRKSGHRLSEKADVRMEEELNRLYPGGAESPRFCYQRDKLAYALMVVAAGMLLSFCMCVSSRQNERSVTRIARGSHGSEQTVALTARLGTEKEEWEETVRITVEGKEYTKEEVEAYMEQVRAAFPEAILGENADIDHVTKPLELIQQIKDNPVIIKWSSSDYGLMDSKGTIQALDIAEEGELCMLTATLSCQGYEQEERFYIRICQGEKTEEEQLREALREALQSQEAQRRTDDEFVLPQEIDGNRVVWIRKEDDNSVIIILLALALAIGVYVSMDRDLKKQIDKRRQRLLAEYPEFVSRLVLLLSAGTTMRGAMYQIAGDYEARRSVRRIRGNETGGKGGEREPGNGVEKIGTGRIRGNHAGQAETGRIKSDNAGQIGTGMIRGNAEWQAGTGRIRGNHAERIGTGKAAGSYGEKRVQIYEEIVYTCHEMDSGIPEAKAYYRLGQRCGEQHYIRLCMLLSQNLKKGTAGLLSLLREESADAFEERKRNARRLGEEAGTKLLLPMMIMLVIVMLIIMVPAFMSFSA